jgi:hypothetical protein
MPTTRRTSKDAPINPYEKCRNETTAANNRKLQSLNLPPMQNLGQNGQSSKRTKVIDKIIAY